MNNILEFLYKEIPGSKGRIDDKLSVSANEIGAMIVRYCEEQKSEIPIVSDRRELLIDFVKYVVDFDSHINGSPESIVDEYISSR